MSNLARLFRPTGALLFALWALLFVSTAFADPSGRVAYLSDIKGAVSYSPSGEDQWIDIVRNRPLIRGDRLWSDRRSRAEFQVGSSAVRLGSETSVELLDLDDDIAQLQLTQGSLNVRVRRLYRGQTIEVDTPMLAFSINRKGRYRIDVDPDDGQTTVTVWQGAGTAYGENASLRVRAGNAVAFYDVDLSDYEIYGLADDDDFDRYALDRDRFLDRSVSLNYLDDDIVGYAELDLYGSWGSHQTYGHVWYPRDVGRDWAPYRDGHWVWQEPWGWTWVDHAPWGFAPSHYGRWVSVHNRWGWVPGPRRVRAVYAPALVAFVGGSGWSVSLSLGRGSSAIGWFPLGPREVYVPSYRASREYFTRVNVNNTVVNNTTITNVYNNYSSGDVNVNQINYVNSNVASAVTAVPSNVFVNAQPVRQAALRFDDKALKGREFTRIAPIAPTEQSVIGTGKAAKDRPNREVFDRRVVARNAPPPADVPFTKREKLLQKQPGRAPEPAAIEAVQKPQDRRTKRVLVVSDQNEPVDTRALETGEKGNTAKQGRLDRSAVAKQKAGRVRSVEQLPVAETKADSDKETAQQRQRKADSDKQDAQQQQRKADNDKEAAQGRQRKADSDKEAAQQRQRKADSDKQDAQQQQRKADNDKEAAQQQQRRADSDKEAAQQRQRKADSDKQDAQQQRQADSDKEAAQGRQRKADRDKEAAQQQQRRADSDKEAAQQRQRKADTDKQNAQQQQRKADNDKEAAQQQQRRADSDKEAAQQRQRKADSDKQDAQQQQRKADNDKQAAQQQQRQADADTQRVQRQTPDPRQNKPDGKNQQTKSKAQAECERNARKHNQDASRCQDEL